ncbi:2-amino-4-hydroxy-6-hydroxymethyldihydropteridine diphosphokinase [Proteus hauseri]|uniref:2-amino-4-hydroxy-6- hydroxymethyldihydropteridine diphosphokinase n=1 Tax=Proteus hauseri TaxID=183417 RepID=UPI0032DBAB02
MSKQKQRVYIILGSNLNSPEEQVKSAIKAISEIPQTELIAQSSWYRTRPMGPQDQPDYLNVAVAIDTDLAPEILLDNTQAIELAHGRVRKEGNRWGPRTLDLDIMLFGNEVIQTERLTVPHYGLKVREFMLYPLAELAPNLRFPDGELLTDRLALVPENGMEKW